MSESPSEKEILIQIFLKDGSLLQRLRDMRGIVTDQEPSFKTDCPITGIRLNFMLEDSETGDCLMFSHVLQHVTESSRSSVLEARIRSVDGSKLLIKTQVNGQTVAVKAARLQ